MKTVKCKNPKTYNLKKGAVYFVNKEIEECYYVTNEKGLSAKYDKALFEISEEIAGEPQVEAVTTPVLLTEQQMIDSITYDDESFTLSYKDELGNDCTIENQLNSDGSSISCGISQIYDINELMNDINADVSTVYSDNELLKKEIFERIVRETVSEGQSLSILSTNTDVVEREIYYGVLDSMSAINSGSFINSNSGNTIKMWGIFRV